MEALLSELGRRLTDRWLTQVLIPGLLWVAAVVCADVLGNTHALDVARLTRWTERAIDDLTHRPAALALTVAATLLTTTAAALGAAACARVILPGWLGHWPPPLDRLASRLVVWRRRRATTGIASQTLPRYLPARPTWMGDKIHLVDQRIDAQYGLSLSLIWPRLWQLLDDTTRGHVETTRERLDGAGRLAGWGVLYAALGMLWWPALTTAVVILLTAWRNGRTAVALFTTTVEATVDLHHRALASALGVALPDHGRFTPNEGAIINDQLNKGA
jgi:hypothetical protein